MEGVLKVVGFLAATLGAWLSGTSAFAGQQSVFAPKQQGKKGAFALAVVIMKNKITIPVLAFLCH